MYIRKENHYIMNTKVLQFCLFLLILCSACKKDGPGIEEKVRKVYTAKSVTHDGLTVYTQGSTSNINPEYTSFRLDLATAGKAKLKDVTAETFTGNYTVTQQNLTLSDLSPQPTGSGGTLSYAITSIDGDGRNLVLTSTKGNPKTGNTVNVYTLVAN